LIGSQNARTFCHAAYITCIFFSVSMPGNKFVCRQDKLAAVSGILNSAKSGT
jgi:hypothetical protein